jgi:pyruvate/2-oxoglutarate dehydrogenase complex dihydrolipoamide dehydrogenase (E3) component
VAVATRALAKVDRAQCDGDAPDGVFKVVYCPKDGTILGKLLRRQPPAVS